MARYERIAYKQAVMKEIQIWLLVGRPVVKFGSIAASAMYPTPEPGTMR